MPRIKIATNTLQLKIRAAMKKRGYSKIASYRSYHELSYSRNGDPSEVLNYTEIDIDPDAEFERSIANYYGRDSSQTSERESLARVVFLYSPINPADINSIEGRYPSPFRTKSSTFPESTDQSGFFPGTTIPGSEVIGIVTHTTDSASSSDTQVGDMVVPVYPGMGTWRSSIVLPSNLFLKINSPYGNKKQSIDPLALSTFNTNPCTAYRLLRDFFPFSEATPSSMILQNGGASSVGMSVSQLAHNMGIKCVSIVRKGTRSESQFQDLASYLINVGKNTLVLQEEQLIQGGKEEIQKALTQIKNVNDGNSPCSSSKPILGLNCVGGESVNVMMKLLQKNSTIVTYGGMSKRPLTIPTGRLIFDQFHFSGYWHSAWLVKNCRSQERIEMMNTVLELIHSNDLVLGERQYFDLREFDEALEFDVFSSSESYQDGAFMKNKAVFRCSTL